MSDRTNGRKTLLPESLPAPVPTTVLPPKERVAQRAHIFLQRFRGLGTTAGAAILSLQCSGYGVVDPLPPPPQQCSALADPFPQLYVTAYFSSGQDAGASPLVLDVSSRGYPATIGFRIDAVRVTGGDLIHIEDLSNPGGPGGVSRFLVSIAPAAVTSQLRVDIDFGCGSATASRHYRVTYQLPGSPSQIAFVDEISDTIDAGASFQPDERTE